MFSCIACTKPTADERDEEHERHQGGTPRTKEAAKSITTQLKGIALKITGSYRQCKPSKGSTSYQRGHPESDTASEDVPSYVGGASATSTPTSDITASNYPGGNNDPTFDDGTFVGVPTPPRGPDTAPNDVVVAGEDESQEWLAEVEEGIVITFASLPNGGNDLRRIRFSREMFDRNLAQTWWIENYNKIRELYYVQSLNGHAVNPPAGRTEDEQGRNSHSALTFAQEGSNRELIPGSQDDPYGNAGNQPSEQLDQAIGHHFNAGSPSVEPSASMTVTPPGSSRGEPSLSNAINEAEWVEQDEPGVFITIRQSADGTRDIRRLRFSRKRFEADDAKIWWLENKERVEAKYL